jgi:hypothetical protein
MCCRRSLEGDGGGSGFGGGWVGVFQHCHQVDVGSGAVGSVGVGSGVVGSVGVGFVWLVRWASVLCGWFGGCRFRRGRHPSAAFSVVWPI